MDERVCVIVSVYFYTYIFVLMNYYKESDCAELDITPCETLLASVTFRPMSQKRGSLMPWMW